MITIFYTFKPLDENNMKETYVNLIQLFSYSEELTYIMS